MHVGATVAGRYRLVELLGVGGMGEVWRATDELLRRTVAVKVVLPALHAETEFSRRFLAEARAMAKVHHPGVVSIYDFGEIDGGTAFLVMEFVAGEPLSRMLNRLGRLAPGTAMELIVQAAQALAAVHAQGIVHRDVKPGNLLVRTGGAVALTDFGIAAGYDTTSLTTPGRILGTLSYLAPEQVMGEPATARSDVYALGLIAYECLTGQRPFPAEEPVAAALQRVQRPAPPLPIGIPPAVAGVVTRALATDPADRWQTAAELAAAARRALTETPEPTQAPESAEEAPEPSETLASQPNRRRRTAVAAAVVAIVLAVGVTLWNTGGRGSRFGALKGDQETGPQISDVSGSARPVDATPSGSPIAGSPIAGIGPGLGGSPGPGVTGGPDGRVSVGGPGDRTGTVGSAIAAVNHTASGGSGPYSWSASGLPPGLSINPASGVVSGTPTTAKQYTVTVTATDSSSPARTGSVSYRWTVTAPAATGCTGSNGTDVSVTDGASGSSRITISGCAGRASAATRAEIRIRCADRADLTVILEAPDASYLTLYSGDGSGANLEQTFTRDLSAEAANGTWRLLVLDNDFDGDVVVIDSWTLTLAAP